MDDGRLTASVAGFCAATGLKRSMTYELIASGQLETIYFGRRRLILMDSYRRLVERQREEQAPGRMRRVQSPNPRARR